MVVGGNSLCSVDHYLVIDLSLRNYARDYFILGRLSILSRLGGVSFFATESEHYFHMFSDILFIISQPR